MEDGKRERGERKGVEWVLWSRTSDRPYSRKKGRRLYFGGLEAVRVSGSCDEQERLSQGPERLILKT